MLGFLSELEKLFKLPVGLSVKDFKFVNVGNRALFVQGKAKILIFSTVKIVLRVGKNKLYVYGRSLAIKHFTDADIAITGEIICTSNREVSMDESV